MKDIKKVEQSLVDGQRKKLKEELMEEILRELRPYIIEVLREELFNSMDFNPPIQKVTEKQRRQNESNTLL